MLFSCIAPRSLSFSSFHLRNESFLSLSSSPRRLPRFLSFAHQSSSTASPFRASFSHFHFHRTRRNRAQLPPRILHFRFALSSLFFHRPATPSPPALFLLFLTSPHLVFLPTPPSFLRPPAYKMAPRGRPPGRKNGSSLGAAQLQTTPKTAPKTAATPATVPTKKTTTTKTATPQAATPQATPVGKKQAAKKGKIGRPSKGTPRSVNATPAAAAAAAAATPATPAPTSEIRVASLSEILANEPVAESIEPADESEAVPMVCFIVVSCFELLLSFWMSSG